MLMQLFAFSVDTFAFEIIGQNDNAAHHELCSNDSAGCQSDLATLPATAETEQCDHCCACHGHFAHVSIVALHNTLPPQFVHGAYNVYATSHQSHINFGIERPPRK